MYFKKFSGARANAQNIVHTLYMRYKDLECVADVFSTSEACSVRDMLVSISHHPGSDVFGTVFYPVPNRINVRDCCHLYECTWLHFLSIE